MKVVYASRTGNVQSLVQSLNVDESLHIESGTESIEGDYILFTYTDGWGDVPYEVEVFLSIHSDHLKGVIVSGDLSYAEAYCVAGDVIAEQYSVPCLYKVENAGTPDDIVKIQEILDSL